MNINYFDWLCSKVDYICDDKDALKTRVLLSRLYDREYYWTIGMDENRSIDGKNLRDIFGLEETYEPCRVLEMLIALAMRIDRDICPSENSNNVAVWFWEMLRNLGLSIDMKLNNVDYILDEWLDRRYDYYGNGGIFPLKRAKKDQRNVDIWYQMQAYVQEKEN